MSRVAKMVSRFGLAIALSSCGLPESYRCNGLGYLVFSGGPQCISLLKDPQTQQLLTSAGDAACEKAKQQVPTGQSQLADAECEKARQEAQIAEIRKLMSAGSGSSGAATVGGIRNAYVTIALSMPAIYVRRPGLTFATTNDPDERVAQRLKEFASKGVKAPPDPWLLVLLYATPGQSGWFASRSPISSHVFLRPSEIDQHLIQQPRDWKVHYRVEIFTTSHVAGRVSFDRMKNSEEKNCPGNSFQFINETKGGPHPLLQNNLESWDEVTFEQVTIGCAGFPDTDRLVRILVFSSDWSLSHHPAFMFSYVVKGKAMTPQQREEGMKLIQSHRPLAPITAGVPAVVARFHPDKSGAAGGVDYQE